MGSPFYQKLHPLVLGVFEPAQARRIMRAIISEGGKDKEVVEIIDNVIFTFPDIL